MSTQPQLVQDATQQLMTLNNSTMPSPSVVPAAQPPVRAPGTSIPVPKPVATGVARPNPNRSVVNPRMVPAGTRQLPTVRPAVMPRTASAPVVPGSGPASVDLVTLFGKELPRKHIYIGMAILLICILGYIWWRGNKEEKDSKVKKNHDQENDDNQRLYQQQQQQMMMSQGRLPPQMMMAPANGQMDPVMMARLAAMQSRVPPGTAPAN